jgi:hypothetical protein
LTHDSGNHVGAASCGQGDYDLDRALGIGVLCLGRDGKACRQRAGQCGAGHGMSGMANFAVSDIADGLEQHAIPLFLKICTSLVIAAVR